MDQPDYSIEANLLDALKRGEESSYNYMFNTYYNSVCIYVAKICQDMFLAEDITQEVFINIWQKREDIHINSSLKNYLYKSAYYYFLNYLRLQKQKVDMLEALKWSMLLDVNTEQEDEAVLEQKIQMMYDAIEALPPKCRRAFKLSRFENLKYREIAEVMGISEKTVETHISKALKILKQSVDATCIALWIETLF